MDPIVSIVVPVYNAAGFLEECLDSLTGQTLKDLEIIAVNDGSTDESPAILERYAARDGRIRMVDQENGGVSRARNAALERARGEYVLFVDADDYIRLDACEVLVSLARETQAEIVVFGGKTFPTVGWADNSFARSKRVCKGSQVADALFTEPGAVPLMCNKLYSRALIERLGARLPESLTLGEDHAFQLSVFPFASVVAYTDEVLYFYREHAGSTLGSGVEARDERVAKHLEVVRAIARSWGKAGLIGARGSELLSWFTSFLHNDLPSASFNVRERVSAGFAQLVAECFTQADIDKLNDTVRSQLDDMLFSCKAFDFEPVMTFVVVDMADGALSEENLHSILNQSEQRIRCLVDDRCAGELASQVMRLDRRCSMVDLSSLGGLLEEVESPYLVFAPTNCRYQRKMVDLVLDHADYAGYSGDAPWVPPSRMPREQRRVNPRGCDVLLMKDCAERVAMLDPYAKVQPPADERFGDVGAFSFGSLGGWGFAIASLSNANKVFSTGFLAAHLPRNGVAPYDAPVQAALAVQFASTILLRPNPLVTFASLEYDDGGSEWAVARELKALADYRSHIEGSLAAGFDEALVRYCLAIDDAMPVHPFNPAAARAVSGVLDLVGDGPVGALDAEEAALIESFVEDDPESHYVKSLEARFAKAAAHSEENLASLDVLSEQVAMLSAEVAEVYNSISYRVGRIVTWPARKGYYGLKRIIARIR